jgi:hypothetical protein
MGKIFRVSDIRDLERRVSNEEISFGKMVEILNSHAYKHFVVNKKCNLQNVNKRYLVEVSDGVVRKNCIVMAVSKKDAWGIARKILEATYGSSWEFSVNEI